MSDSADVQPEEVWGAEVVLVSSDLQKVCLLVPDGVDVPVETEVLLGVLPLQLGPLGVCEHVVHQGLNNMVTHQVLCCFVETVAQRGNLLLTRSDSLQIQKSFSVKPTFDLVISVVWLWLVLTSLVNFHSLDNCWITGWSQISYYSINDKDVAFSDLNIGMIYIFTQLISVLWIWPCSLWRSTCWTSRRGTPHSCAWTSSCSKPSLW